MKADSKNRIGGVVDLVFFDTKLNKVKEESGVELLWHKNIYFYKLSQPQKDELVVWNSNANGMKSKEA